MLLMRVMMGRENKLKKDKMICKATERKEYISEEIEMVEFNKLVEQWDLKYAGMQLGEDTLSVEEVLAMFDDNGNRIVDDYIEEKVEKLLEELEEEYGYIPDVDNLLSVEQILAMYDENGNKIDNSEKTQNGEIKVDKIENRRHNRSRRKKKGSSTAQVDIIHSNSCGYTSKQESWADILKNELPSVVTINETALKGKRQIK